MNFELPHTSGPAAQALANAKIKTLKDLAQWSEKELLKLHGVGPASLPKFRAALAEHGLSFKK